MAVLGIDTESNTIELSSNDRKQGTYIIGVNGTGKTVLLLNIALSDIQSGDGLCFLDPHGDAIETLLTLIPESRKNDVILFDPSDIDHPLGLNVFECPDISDPRLVDLVCSEVVGTFKKLYQEFWGPRLEDILRHATLTVLYNPGATMLDLHLILIDEVYRKKLLKNVSDPLIHQYWKLIFPESKKEMREWLSSAYNKIGRFMANSLIRNIVCQPQSSINLREIMDEGKILIAALSRAETEFEKRRKFHLIVDEYHSFATQSFPTLQSEARKFKIDTLVAHQYRDQRIVEWVYLFRFLTREHIHLLEFKDKSIAACQKRLTFLYHNGYLDAILKPIPSGYGSSKRVYCLSEKGKELIAHMYDSIDPKEIKWKKSYNDVEGYFLEHTLAINDVRVALTVATRGKGYVLEWIPEWELKALKERVEDPERQGKYIAITPDAYFVVKGEGRKASFFLEADRATEANKRFKEKVKGYIEYIRTKKYQERYKTSSLRVLVVTTTKERLKNLTNTTQSINGASFFWFTTFKEADHNDILTKPIWVLTKKEEKKSLL